MASANPFAICKRTYINQSLTALNIALDHPIERAAIHQLINTFGNHARGMELFGRQTSRTLFRQTEINPGCKVFNTVATDTQFYDMEWHKRDLTNMRACFKAENSAGNHIDGKTALTGFLITLAHIKPGLTHRLDAGIKRDKMFAIALYRQ